MKIGDQIKITKLPPMAPPQIVGATGFIDDDSGFINGIQSYYVILLDDKGIPIGNGDVPVVCMEVIDDPIVKKAIDIFNNDIKKMAEGTKATALEIEKGLEDLAIKHCMPVAKLREIYTDVYDLTKGLINEQIKKPEDK